MKGLFLVVASFISFTSFAQIQYRNIPFSLALQQAKDESRLIFLQFEASDCRQCNEVADKGLSDSKLVNQVEATFVPIKISSSHPERAILAQKYNLEKGFGTLFIDHNGTLLHKYGMTTTVAAEYFKQIAIALNKAGEALKVSALEKEYKTNKTIGIIELLLEKRKTLNLPTDELLDEYVSLLPQDSFKSAHTFKFIAKMAPIIGSKADTILRQTFQVFNKSWYEMPNNVRIQINRMIVYKSMAKAIKEKNEAYALRVAGFAQRVHNTNPAAGAKAYEYEMLRFYDETGDTAKYFTKAIGYYDRYFMSVNADTIKNNDRRQMERMEVMAKSDTMRSEKGFTVRKTVSYAPIAQTFTSELVAGANAFYKKTKNPYLLAIATEWAKKGLEFFESPQAWEIYARLLYKQSKTDEAIEAMKKNISMRQKTRYTTEEHEAVLNKMQKGLPVD